MSGTTSRPRCPSSTSCVSAGSGDADSLQNGSAPFRGCLPSITMDKLGFKALVLEQYWSAPPPYLTRFSPGHDARLSSAVYKTRIPIALEYSGPIDCATITRSVALNTVTSSSFAPYIDPLTVRCTELPPPPRTYVGVLGSTFRWSATIADAADGVYELIVANATGRGEVDHLLARLWGSLPSDPKKDPQGHRDQPDRLPDAKSLRARPPHLRRPRHRHDQARRRRRRSGPSLRRPDATDESKFRYSTDYRRTWSEWAVYASTPTALPWSAFNGSALTQRHIDVQVRLDGHRAAEPSLYWSSIAASASHQASADMVKLPDGHTRIFRNLYAVGGPGHRHSAETISAAHSTPSATTWASCRPCRGSGTEPGP